MTIYRIKSDGFKYKTLDLEIDDIIDLMPDHYEFMDIYDFSKNNLALAKDWPAMRTGYFEIEDGENLTPDITPWVNASLFLNPKAVRYLGELLHQFGELLPIQVEDKDCFVFNCLTTVNALPGTTETETLLDEKKCSDTVIFKIPELNCMDLYCTQQMKEIVEYYDLKGLEFDTNLAQFS